MKTNHTHRILAALLAVSFLAMLSPGNTRAAKFSSAKITKKINVVELLLPDGSKKSAEVGSTVSGDTAVQTGSRSRARLSTV